jgi:predicted nucleotidyltransferase
MRLTAKEKDAIRTSAIQVFGSHTEVVLFGSRTIDTSRGGDIDLLIIPPQGSIRSEIFNKKIQFIVKVLDYIGDQKIDVIVKYPGDTRGIVQTALNEGVRIC